MCRCLVLGFNFSAQVPPDPVFPLDRGSCGKGLGDVLESSRPYMDWFLPHPLALVTMDRLLKLTHFHICKVGGRELFLGTKGGSSQ